MNNCVYHVDVFLLDNRLSYREGQPMDPMLKATVDILQVAAIVDSGPKTADLILISGSRIATNHSRQELRDKWTEGLTFAATDHS